MKLLFSWFNRNRRAERDQDLQRELQSHLEAEADEQTGRGISTDQARRAAHLLFGNATLAAENTRDAWGWAALDRLAQDVRFAARTLRKNLGYTALAVIVLALGIGANTAIFTAVNAALLRPLPFDHPEQLVYLWQTPPQRHEGAPVYGLRSSVAKANFLEWQAQQHSFESMALYHFHGLNLTGGDRPDFLPGAEVTEQFFAVFHQQPLLGRTFTADEMQPGHDHEVILSYSVWQTYFGGDRGIVGREFSFDRQSYTIIGVMPKEFSFPGWARIWVPVAWTPADRLHHNGGNSLAIARLNSGVTPQQAQADMQVIAQHLADAYPTELKGWGAMIEPMHDNYVADLRTPLLVLLGAVAFVLLIACSNVANLVLAKTLSRRKEIAIRSALGASRARMLQLVMVETVLLALGGGALGLLTAYFGIRLLVSFLVNRLPTVIHIQLDGRVLVFALAISLICGVLAGLLPALRFTRIKADVNQALKEGLGRTDSDSGRVRLRSALVVTETALCMVLLIGAGLLVRTLWALQNVNLGFDPHDVLTVETPRGNLPAGANMHFLEEVLQRVRTLPGVRAAAATNNIPVSGEDEEYWPVQVEGQAPQPVVRLPKIDTDIVTGGFFSALRIPILRGRDFNESDTASRSRVIIISQAMASRLWPGQDPIGRRVFTPIFEPDQPREVIAIAGDTKERGLERFQPVPIMYLPGTQAPRAPDSLLIRTAQPASEIIPEVTRAVHDVDRQQPVIRAMPLDDIIAASYSDRRFAMLLLAGFALLALVLAAAGIYGVLSYSVRRRLREIGIRLALGANVGDVLRLVVLEGMRPTLIGVALGIAGALALARVLQTMIFGVRPTDIRTYAAVAALLIAVSLFACVVPAWRATRVQPLNVLRDE